MGEHFNQAFEAERKKREGLIARGPLYELLLRNSHTPEEVEQLVLEYPINDLEFLARKAPWILNKHGSSPEDVIRDYEPNYLFPVSLQSGNRLWRRS